MESYRGTGFAAAALAIYILGGMGTFIGLFLILLVGGRNVAELGDGRSLGYLLFCIGLGFSIAGVLLMRLMRNRMGK